MIAADEAMARTLQRTNTACTGIAAASANPAAPTVRMRDAAMLTGQPRALTNDTATGEQSSPTLPDAATIALANAPASNHRSAINSRNVLPAVSRTPDAAERHSSKRNVIRVRSCSKAGRLRGGTKGGQNKCDRKKVTRKAWRALPNARANKP